MPQRAWLLQHAVYWAMEDVEDVHTVYVEDGVDLNSFQV